MNVTYTSFNGRMVFHFEGATQKDVFARLSMIQEVFEESECGACEGKNLKYNVREFDGNSYYKLTCMDCGAQLDFGQNKQGGTLFARRYDTETKQNLANNGWYKYQKAQQSQG